jgi:hypothetical protein
MINCGCLMESKREKHLRNFVIDKLIEIKEKYSDFVANTSKQLNLFRNGKWTADCPTWFFLNLDSNGKIKQPCIISSADQNGAKPICEKCGLGCYAGAYSGLFLSDGEWLRMFKIAKNTKNRLFSDFIYERVYFRFDVVEVG